MALTALDHEEIKQVLARYGHTIDFFDVDGFLACFAPDGMFEVPDRRWEGREGLREFIEGVSSRQGGHVRHAMLSSLIQGDGGTASSVTYAVVTHDYGVPAGRGQVTHSTMLTSGVYTDEFTKVDGRWLFAKRSFRWDGTAEALERIGRTLEIDHVDAGVSDGGVLAPIDHEAIRQLLTRFAYALDFQDLDTFVGCFTPVGVLEMLALPEAGGTIRASGTENLREFARVQGQRGAGHMRYTPITILIESHGARARASSYCFNAFDQLYQLVPVEGASPSWQPPRGGVAVGKTGIFRDELEKVNGRWLFARRTFRYDGWPEVVAEVGHPVDLGPFDELTEIS